MTEPIPSCTYNRQLFHCGYADDPAAQRSGCPAFRPTGHKSSCMYICDMQLGGFEDLCSHPNRDKSKKAGTKVLS